MSYGSVTFWCLFVLIFNFSVSTSERNKTHETACYSYPRRVLDRAVQHQNGSNLWKSHLTRSSIIYGLTEVVYSSDQNVTQCSEQMKHLQRSILSKEIWAMKALDASGEKSSGFLFGHNYWLGNREACSYVHRPVPLSLSAQYKRVMHYGLLNETSPFAMDYRVVYLQHNSPWQVEVKIWSEQIIHVGLCVPSVCANTEILQLMSKYIEDDVSVDNHIYEMRPQVLYIKDLKVSDQFYKSTNYRMVKGYVIFILVMVLMAVYVRRTSSKDTNWNTLERFILRFDIVENWSKLYTTHRSGAGSGDIPVINGLHSVLALLIILIHVPIFMYFTINNKPLVFAFIEEKFFPYLASMNIVDAFFTISGFLQTYHFMRKRKNENTVQHKNFWEYFKQFLKKLYHRYLRIFPLYIFVMIAASLLSTYMDQVSAFHSIDRYGVKCAKYWWRNMLSIQNFYEFNDSCLLWSWSLACEMQFFTLATILQFIYPIYPKLVKSLVLLILASSILWCYIVGLAVNFHFSFDVLLGTVHYIYVNSIVRAAPYFLGVTAAWYLVEFKKNQISLTDRQESFLWTFSLAIISASVLVIIKADLPTIYGISVIVWGRLSFTFAFCWIIIASATQRSCWLTRLLEVKSLQHTSKLSYALYSANPLIITLLFNLTDASIHADVATVFILSCGFVLIVYLVAIPLHLLFEMPFNDNVIIYKSNN